MNVCPVCGLPLNGKRALNTHLEVKHGDAKYLTVEPSGREFTIKIRDTYPKGSWDHIGIFLRESDEQHFIVLGRGIYAGEVSTERLSAAISDFLGLGRRIL